MNPQLDFIFTRRSVRKYLAKEIPAEMLNDLLEAGMAAPSARATDPWHFIVITKRETLDRMVTALPNGKMLLTAPAALVVCGDMHRALEGYESYMLQDVSAAVENILLAAGGLGLGSCWLGIHPRPDRMDGIRALFQSARTYSAGGGHRPGLARDHPRGQDPLSAGVRASGGLAGVTAGRNSIISFAMTGSWSERTGLEISALFRQRMAGSETLGPDHPAARQRSRRRGTLWWNWRSISIPAVILTGYRCAVSSAGSTTSRFNLWGKAAQLLHWQKNHRYCGHCGAGNGAP